ncbi:Iron-sulfur cluster carrier protein [Pandoraea terrae]|uniref:Iron-sulfur cluster carrier protein n=1 Tax=Pandoraea terrae TaxID=1537710 RepID=A0A5E4S0L4_9BURK|nr:cellulose biosynthesis protein BcsQ [Pandoraea terrae]VVD68252.1 Iron-sulfur cluster carrier protein [Pandoraea terrae]
MLTLIAVASSAGGAGRTTLVANLAALLAREGVPVLALELDPQNVLASQLGLDVPPALGIVSFVDTPQRLSEAVQRPRPALALLPSGQGDAAMQARLCETLTREPAWLRQQLGHLGLPPGTVVLVDTDRYPSAVSRHAVAAADIVLGVVPLTSAGYVTLPDLMHAGARRLHIVTNWASSPSPVNNDLYHLVKARAGSAILPMRIHRDGMLSEASARGVPVFEHAEGAQSATDIAQLADWLRAAIAASPGPATATFGGGRTA